MPKKLIFLFVLLWSGLAFAEYPPDPEPDARYKADILLVVAHPDDEGMAIAYFARAILDQHKRVAVVYGTRGNGGGNAVGLEQASVLGAEREIEARRALATVGIVNVWFIGAPDTPGQDVLRSLETWNHGSSLGQVVRLMRLTRPQVVMSWLPDYVAGENHGDHQAASVLATEAFDLAGDPTAFPEQVAPPRDHVVSGNLTEGLRPWQPQKLYYFSDTAKPEVLDGKGPRYSGDDVSPARGLPYFRIALESIANHLTQDYPGQLAANVIRSGNFKAFQGWWSRFVFGKSIVPASITGDIFEGTVSGPVAFVRSPGYTPEHEEGVTAQLGGPWAFYRQFWKAHGLSGLPSLFPTEVRLPTASKLSIPVLLQNNTGQETTIDVAATAPAGWGKIIGTGAYRLRPNESRSATVVFATPAKAEPAWQNVQVNVQSGAKTIAELPIHVNLAADSLPQ